MVYAWNSLQLSRARRGSITRARINLTEDSAGRPYQLPVLIARGQKDGPVFGLTAMVHGNEVNGAPLIHRLFRELRLSKLTGTIVAVPVVNLPGYLRNIREFLDGADLNRHMPGKIHGTPSEMYNERFITRIISKFEYVIDLHTASFGRANSVYVRANLDIPAANKMAQLIRPQIIVNNTGADGSLRHACHERGIPAVTLEVGNPLVIQNKLVDIALDGVRNVMSHFGMIPRRRAKHPLPSPVICDSSYWLYSDVGGLLEVEVHNLDQVKRGQAVGQVCNLFGDLVGEFHSPEDGIVVGKSTNPICYAGSRLIHLGLLSSDSV